MKAESATTPTLAEAARRLVAANSQGVLCTLRAEDGYPYGSVIDYLALGDGDVLMLLSSLAEHQKYLSTDPRACVLIAPGLGKAEMLAEARIALIGDVSEVTDPTEFRAAYLARHPQAAAYIDFADFRFYRLHAREVRYIAGFGRMGWVTAVDYRAVAQK